MEQSDSNVEKVIFITGVSRGIGRELFLQCAVRKDLVVIGVARSTEALNELKMECGQKGGGDYHLFAHDLSQPTLPVEVERVLGEYAKLDAVINNAGYLVNKPFMEIERDEWLRCYETNVYAPYRLTQLLYAFLKKSNLAHIVNIGSMGGVQGSSKFAGLSAYSSSKAALIGLTECLAEELKETNIKVNIVNLGAVQTEMLAEAFPGFKPDHQPAEIATWLINFALTASRLMNGKSVMLSDSTP